MNMLGMNNDDIAIPNKKKQGLYTPYDDGRK